MIGSEVTPGSSPYYSELVLALLRLISLVSGILCFEALFSLTPLPAVQLSHSHSMCIIYKDV